MRNFAVKINLALALLLFLTFSLKAAPQTSVTKVWEGTSVRASSVTLTAFIPERPSGTAVIVCPGGSYHWHASETEGSDVALWLNSKGISAFVLNYRAAGVLEFVTHYRFFLRGKRFPDMFCDIQRAIDLVRSGDWGIEIGRLGLMGFSAGGHLVMAAAEFFETDFVQESYHIPTKSSLRPDFVVPVYPVVSMSDENMVHRRSRRGLLGERRMGKQALRDSLSLEKHVPKDCPPVFLVNCKDDPTVDWRNSEVLDSALTEAGVPHHYLQFESGGHGFGVNGQEGELWREEFLLWLEKIGV